MQTHGSSHCPAHQGLLGVGGCWLQPPPPDWVCKMRVEALEPGVHLLSLQPTAQGAFLRGSGLSLASGRFTAPVSAIFQFSASLHVGEWGWARVCVVGWELALLGRHPTLQALGLGPAVEVPPAPTLAPTGDLDRASRHPPQPTATPGPEAPSPCLCPSLPHPPQGLLQTWCVSADHRELQGRGQLRARDTVRALICIESLCHRHA